MPKHPCAVYYDSNSVRRELKPDELHDVSKRAAARETELWDPDEEYRLYPRYRQDSPHFYSLSKNTRRYATRAENDPAHDERVESLLDLLQRKQGYKIGFLTQDSGEQQFITFVRTNGYLWGKEVSRAISENVRCRHDLFGARMELRLSAGSPWVAIEVVKDHYPEQQAFDALLVLTRNLPLLVLFDFIEVPNYFFQVREADATIRIIYYIYDGSVWKNEKRLESCTHIYFRERVEDHLRWLANKNERA